MHYLSPKYIFYFHLLYLPLPVNDQEPPCPVDWPCVGARIFLHHSVLCAAEYLPESLQLYHVAKCLNKQKIIVLNYCCNSSGMSFFVERSEMSPVKFKCKEVIISCLIIHNMFIRVPKQGLETIQYILLGIFVHHVSDIIC